VSYDNSSVESIVEFAGALIGKSLSEATSYPREELEAAGKGKLGLLVETKFFELPQSSKPTPDFEAAGLELKVIPLKKYARRTGLHPKENLKLTSLNPFEVDEETWETSRVVTKCGLMLILTFHFEEGKIPIDMKFTQQRIVNLLDTGQLDTAQFKRDWETIQRFIHLGKGHELSCGSTNYLIANTSGAGHGKTRKQPHSDVPMKPRSFMIKKDYLDYFLVGAPMPNVLPAGLEMSIDEAAASLLQPLIGKKVEELALKTNLSGTPKTNKGYHRNLAVRLLGGTGRSIPEFDKAGIKPKTIRLKESGKMREEMSFKNFQYLQLVKEEWEDSVFRAEIEQKFLFLVFKELPDGSEVFHNAGFWDMPHMDRLEAKEVWEETKRRVANNNHVLPKISETRVAHVRPHGKNKLDTYPTPHGGEETKKGFWLNKNYLQEVVDNLPSI